MYCLCTSILHSFPLDIKLPISASYARICAKAFKWTTWTQVDSTLKHLQILIKEMLTANCKRSKELHALFGLPWHLPLYTSCLTEGFWIRQNQRAQKHALTFSGTTCTRWIAPPNGRTLIKSAHNGRTCQDQEEIRCVYPAKQCSCARISVFVRFISMDHTIDVFVRSIHINGLSMYHTSMPESVVPDALANACAIARFYVRAWASAVLQLLGIDLPNSQDTYVHMAWFGLAAW